MDILTLTLKSVILGIVEGITEFLPVSSTGHLVIFENLLHFKAVTKNYVEMYTYVIQLGAILAVIVLYWKKIMDTLINLFPSKRVSYKESGLRFWLVIVLACVPGAVVEIGFGDLADKYLFNYISVALVLILGAVLILYAEQKFRKNKVSNDLNVTAKQALVVGIFQCLAIIPGMSRSASTIIGGWVSGLSTVAAAEFSFFLAIPVMAGMSLLKILKAGGILNLTSAEIISLTVGFVVSFIVALVVVDRFISYLKKKPMKVFAYYRIVFAIIVLITGFAGIFK